MATERRYRIGLHPSYDKFYDYKKSDSAILRPKNPQNISKEELIYISDAKGLKTLLYLYTGDENKKCQRQPQDRPTPSKILEKQNQIDHIENEFKKVKQNAVNLGQIPPRKMSKELDKSYQESLAEYDLTMEEINQIKKLLETAKDKVEKTTNENMLAWGPKLAGQGDPLRSIDGQKVEIIGGIPTIIEPDSPYNKMQVVVYRELIALPWIMAKKKKFRLDFGEYEKRVQTDSSTTPPKLSPARVSRHNLPPRPSEKTIEKFLIENGIIEIEESEDTK